jgi:thiosulfate/3-mercaptopyruvate sulfurtransferase
MARDVWRAAQIFALCLAPIGIGTAAAWPGPPNLILAADAVPDYLTAHTPIILSVQSVLAKSTPGYLRGALRVNEDDWTVASRSQKQLEDLNAWGARFGALGIDGKRPVLIYDDGELKFASRVRYLLAHFGIKDALLVNGGWQSLAVLVAKKDLEAQGSSSLAHPAHYDAHVVEAPIPIATRDEVLRVYKSPDVTLIDVRTPDEYNGIGPQPIPGIRPGHIPGAINVPLSKLLDPNHQNELLGPVLLAGMFAVYHIDPKKRLIFYCVDGARSSLGALAAKRAEFKNVDLYYLSYLDWQSNRNDPIEK